MNAQASVLLLAALIGGPQLMVLYRYWRATAGRKVVGSPTAALEAEAGGNPRMAALLVLLSVAASIFVFTQAAEQLALWEGFPALMLGSVSLIGLFLVVRALRRGRVVPLIRGFDGPYERAIHPVAFWVSMAWNGALVLIGLVATGMFATQSAFPPPDESCFDRTIAPAERIEACNTAIADAATDGSLHGALLIARGSAKEDARSGATGTADYREGAAVLDGVIRTGTAEHADYYNQGLAYASLGEPEKALGSFSEAILRDPQDADAHLERGNMLLDLMRPNEAWKEYDRVLQIEPDHGWARANRGMASAWMGDEKGARKDFAGVASTDRAMVVVRRGEALLAYNVRDWDRALTYLDEALAADPDDGWSKRLRAEVLDRASRAAQQAQQAQQPSVPRPADAG